MRIIKYPERYTQETLSSTDIICFMGGGMGNTEWHKRFFDELNNYCLNHLVIITPYNDNITSIWEQVQWEFYHLNNFVNKNFIFSMYFDKYTDQPISMYELGRALALCKPSYVKVSTGVQDVAVVQNYGFPVVLSMHEEAPKKEDLKCQVGLLHETIWERTPEEHAQALIRVYKDIKQNM